MTADIDLAELVAMLAKNAAHHKKTYSFDEACDYLHVSASSLSDLITTGELPAAKISKSWVLREEDLAKYLADEVRIQTEQRREAYQSGRAAHIKPAVSLVRKERRRVLPVLPPLPS